MFRPMIATDDFADQILANNRVGGRFHDTRQPAMHLLHLFDLSGNVAENVTLLKSGNLLLFSRDGMLTNSMNPGFSVGLRPSFNSTDIGSVGSVFSRQRERCAMKFFLSPLAMNETKGQSLNWVWRGFQQTHPGTIDFPDQACLCQGDKTDRRAIK